jgi:hypothetical protein
MGILRWSLLELRFLFLFKNDCNFPVCFNSSYLQRITCEYVIHMLLSMTHTCKDIIITLLPERVPSSQNSSSRRGSFLFSPCPTLLAYEREVCLKPSDFFVFQLTVAWRCHGKQLVISTLETVVSIYMISV